MEASCPVRFGDDEEEGEEQEEEVTEETGHTVIFTIKLMFSVIKNPLHPHECLPLFIATSGRVSLNLPSNV